jgi:aminoglycoside phosphotransferase (APT) family kinase protein
MDSSALPYLKYLRGTFSNLSAATSADPGLAMQNGAASRLLDCMTVESTVTPALKAESYGALLRLLPDSAALVGKDRELRELCAAADPAAFDRFLQMASAMQRKLLALNTAKARALCKSIIRIEFEFNRKVEAAVIAQSAVSATANAAIARNARAYDEKALLDFIRKMFPQEADVAIEESSVISGGYSKFTVSITLSNAKSLPTNIILRADAAATFGGASTVDEYRLIKILYEHGIRVPKPLAAEETGQVIGSRFMLVEKKPGISVGHMFNLPAPSKSICRDVAEQLAAIHQIPVETFGNRVNNFDARSSDKALAWIAEGQKAWEPLTMPSPVFATAFEWLRGNAGLNDNAPRALVHGDVHLANMLVADDRISTILDWEFAHIGNPAYDLGYFYDQAIALDSWEAFLGAYADAGAAVPDEDQLNYAILFAATRLGVMTCQSRREFTAGEKPGLAGAVVIGNFFYEATIMRMAKALDRVL